MTELFGIAALVIAVLGLLAWLHYSGEPQQPEPAAWHCFEPGPPCTPDDPCSDSCGRPVGHLKEMSRPRTSGTARNQPHN